MRIRTLAVALALALCAAAGLPAQSNVFPVSELRAGMVGVGKTVFEGDRLDDFKVTIIGVLRNSIGTRRDLILARLDGGPLANAGVIAGMSGSPVYIDGRMVGAVSYSLGQFSKEPIAGITPIGEMTEAANLGLSTGATPRRQAAAMDLPLPLTQESFRASLRQAFSWIQPFATSPADVQVLGGGSVINAGISTMLRPIATPLTFGGFDPTVIDPMVSMFRDQGFVPVLAGAQTALAEPLAAGRPAPLRPGDPVGVSLINGDLDIGATGTITAIEGDRLYAFGHPFYALGPVNFPMTRAHVLTVLPSFQSSQKIASSGEIVGTFSQDRATTLAGKLGAGPAMIPITLTLRSDRSATKTFKMGMVNDELFTPLLAYVSILNTLTSYERTNGVGTFSLRGAAAVKGHGNIAFEDLFTGDQPSASAAASIVAPINLLMRNAFEGVELESLSLELDASEQPRSATLERVWVDGSRVRPGSTVDLKMLLRTYRGEEVTRTLPIQIPANASGTVSIMVADGGRLGQWEQRELQIQPAAARGLPQMIQVLNSSRRNNRLYIRLVTRDAGAVVKGESLAALPASVLAVMESDRNGGSFRPLQSALSGEWEITPGYAVSGSRTLTLPIED